MPKLSLRRLLTYLAVAGLSTVFAILTLNNLYSPSQKHCTLISKELYNVISPSSYKYVLNQPDLCEKKRPYLVLMIPVTLRETEARTAIRKTWGQESLTPRGTVLRFFVIGQPAQSDPILQQQLEIESKEYGDIIQMDFVDTYQNLTIKTMMVMNWIATYCQSARYAMKIDADNFLNVPFLVNYLHAKGESLRDYITGSLIRDGHPNRNSLSKWSLSEDLYPDTSYPPYVSGAAYVFSADLALKISLASRCVQPLPLEDVYVGLCLRVLGVKPVYSTHFLRLRNLFEVRKLKYDRCTFASRIIVNGFKPQELLYIWHDFQKAHFTC